MLSRRRFASLMVLPALAPLRLSASTDALELDGLLLQASRTIRNETNELVVSVASFDLTTVTGAYKGFTALSAMATDPDAPENQDAFGIEDVTLSDKDHPNFPSPANIEQARYYHARHGERAGDDITISVIQRGTLVYVWRHTGPSRDSSWLAIDRFYDGFTDDIVATYTFDTILQTLPDLDSLTDIFPEASPGEVVEEYRRDAR